MIKSGIVIGLKPDEIRAMTPKDCWLCFQGWNEAHAPKEPGSDAPTIEQYQELVRLSEDGSNNSARA